MSKYNVTLKDIDLEALHKKYNMTYINTPNIQTNIQTTTNIDDLFKNTSNTTISFLDESHISKVYDICIIDSRSDYDCYWCRHSFTSFPVFCPINYTGMKVEKTYNSLLTKVVNESVVKITYKIKEEITQDPKSNMFQLVQNAEYITDGIFCSFNCCQAFINDNKTNPLYNLSSCLLIKIYNTIFPTRPIKLIIPAPHWRCLTRYGGKYSIEAFRKSFNTIESEYQGLYKQTSLGHIYEEKLRLN